MIKKFFEKNIVMRYLVSGGLAFTVDIVLLYILTDLFHVWYIVSSVIAFSIAVIASFLMQKFWTFQHMETRGMHGQFGVFLLVSICNVALNTVLMHTFVERFHMWYLLGQIFASGIVAVISFFVYRHFIFQRKPEI